MPPSAAGAQGIRDIGEKVTFLPFARLDPTRTRMSCRTGGRVKRLGAQALAEVPPAGVQPPVPTASSPALTTARLALMAPKTSVRHGVPAGLPPASLGRSQSQMASTCGSFSL